MNIGEQISSVFAWVVGYGQFSIVVIFIVTLALYPTLNSWIVAYLNGRKNDELFRSLPDLPTYLENNPSCRSSGGPRCVNCNSIHFGSYAVHKFGFITNPFLGRVHFCRKCRTALYKTDC